MNHELGWVAGGWTRKINTKLNENIEKKKHRRIDNEFKIQGFAKQNTKTTNQLDHFLKKKKDKEERTQIHKIEIKQGKQLLNNAFGNACQLMVF